MKRARIVGIIQRALALVATLFGLVTIVAGTRVLAGTDPGYVVFRPLLLYNTAMGFVYVAAGVIAWRNIYWGKYAAAGTFVFNLLVLVAIGFLYTAGHAVAMDSLRAMVLRTAVWFVLFLGLAWLSRGTQKG